MIKIMVIEDIKKAAHTWHMMRKEMVGWKGGWILEWANAWEARPLKLLSTWNLTHKNVCGNSLLLVNTFVSEPKMPCGLKHFLTHQQLRITKYMFKKEIKFNSFWYVWMGTYIILAKLQWYFLNWQQVWPHFLQFPIMNELVNSLKPVWHQIFQWCWFLSNLRLGWILINFICFYYEIFDYFIQSLIFGESSGKSYHLNSWPFWVEWCQYLSHSALLGVGRRVGRNSVSHTWVIGPRRWMTWKSHCE